MGRRTVSTPRWYCELGAVGLTVASTIGTLNLSMSNRTSITRARSNLARLFDEVAKSGEPYIIERRNGENVALISESELNSLLETEHVLRSPRNARRLADALERALGR